MPYNKNILVPTDFSSKSDIAMRYACDLAWHTGAKIQFLNVIEPPYDFPSRAEEIIEVRKKENAEELKQLIDGLYSVDDFRSLVLKGEISTGKVESTILEKAVEHQTELIAIGLGGKQDLKKMMYGSITNNILLKSDIPVLAISKQIDFRTPECLVFTTNLRDEDLKQIKKIKKLAVEIGAVLNVLHVDDIQTDEHREKIRQFEQKLGKLFKKNGVSLSTITADSFLEGVMRTIGNRKDTILVMCRYKRSFFEWLFENSSVRAIAKITLVPLLMIPMDQS